MRRGRCCCLLLVLPPVPGAGDGTVAPGQHIPGWLRGRYNNDALEYFCPTCHQSEAGNGTESWIQTPLPPGGWKTEIVP